MNTPAKKSAAANTAKGNNSKTHTGTVGTPAGTPTPQRRSTDGTGDGTANTEGDTAAEVATQEAAKGTGKVPDVQATIDGTRLVLAFANGKVLMIDGGKLPDDIKAQAMMHGLKQKCVDAAAIARDTTNGRSATVQDKFDAVEDIVLRLTGDAPTWNKVREGNGSAPGSNLLVRALMELSGKDRAATLAFLESKTKEEVAALRKNPQVAAIIVRMQAEAAKAELAKADGKGVDSEAVLKAFMGGTEPAKA